MSNPPGFLAILVLLASTVSPVSAAEDFFTISTSNGLELTQNSKRAKIFSANEDMWDFRSSGLELRISARKLSEENPISETNVFGTANTILFFYTDVSGKRTRISCHGGDEPEGWVKRTALTETHVSASFQVDMTSCRNFYTSEDIPLDGLPIRVKGKFSVKRKSFY